MRKKFLNWFFLLFRKNRNSNPLELEPDIFSESVKKTHIQILRSLMGGDRGIHN